MLNESKVTKRSGRRGATSSSNRPGHLELYICVPTINETTWRISN